MSIYIALLRGINVGGKNKIPMPELKSAFEESGFVNVKTYINSGNVIFSSSISNEERLKRECEFLIADKFKFDISVAVISRNSLSDALHNAPVWWDNDSRSKHNALFVIPPVTAETIINQIGTFNPEYEQVGFYGQIIFWSAPLKTFSRTRLTKIVSKPVFLNVTIRNANTTKKLLQLVENQCTVPEK